ncbi:hypothetical protein BPAE_0055g00420 [Botrytis paeoniae]|uniref:Uncharacterized protein n=1 Tax=Botrytis paeoniae TaxID=278948 RepID=A0A4Z1FTL9_9HELO|nr:hypothetical protein BPAE_0055g00420 [Botrytis paeoniae]
MAVYLKVAEEKDLEAACHLEDSDQSKDLGSLETKYIEPRSSLESFTYPQLLKPSNLLEAFCGLFRWLVDFTISSLSAMTKDGRFNWRQDFMRAKRM